MRGAHHCIHRVRGLEIEDRSVDGREASREQNRETWYGRVRHLRGVMAVRGQVEVERFNSDSTQDKQVDTAAAAQ